jgi:hypothetical protein
LKPACSFLDSENSPQYIAFTMAHGDRTSYSFYIPLGFSAEEWAKHLSPAKKTSSTD